MQTEADRNAVVVGERAALATRTVRLEDVELRRSPQRIRAAQLRHRAPVTAVEAVETDGDELLLRFVDPAERVAPGQVACLLDGDSVIGCGTVAPAGA